MPTDWRMTEGPSASTHGLGLHKRERIREEQAALEGLRSPHRSVQGRAEALVIGRRIFDQMSRSTIQQYRYVFIGGRGEAAIAGRRRVD